jgi:molybdopterin molybdotransferase
MTQTISHQACCADAESHALTVPQALEKIMAAVPVLQSTEKVALRSSLGRVLAQLITSPIQVPAYANSAMDGYAIHARELDVTPTQTLRIVGTSWAGRPFTGQVQAGECIRIMTGAAIPDGVDTVIMQEHVEATTETIKFNTAAHQAGQNMRLAGEDLQIGQTVLQPGRVILPPDLGLLASLGIGEVRIKRRLRVALFSSGDELCSIGDLLQPGQIYDSNRYALYGMLTRLGVDIIDMGVIPDVPEQLQHALLEAADNADVLITSGGVSVGDADFIKDILQQVGTVNFWRIAMKPGHPVAFGTVKNMTFFGLPGNPVSLMVTFYQIVQPALRYMQGQQDDPTQFRVIKARCSSKLKKKKGRAEFQRGILSQDTQGEWTVRSSGAQGSHILRSMSEANCFIWLNAEQTLVETGEWVDVQPFAGLM